MGISLFHSERIDAEEGIVPPSDTTRHRGAQREGQGGTGGHATVTFIQGFQLCNAPTNSITRFAARSTAVINSATAPLPITPTTTGIITSLIVLSLTLTLTNSNLL